MTFGKTKFEHLMEQQRQRKGDKMRTHRICGECRNSKSWEQNKLLCKKDGIEVIPEDCCGDFVPKTESFAEKLEAAAKKCATTGNRYDLQQYLKLRRGML